MRCANPRKLASTLVCHFGTSCILASICSLGTVLSLFLGLSLSFTLLVTTNRCCSVAVPLFLSFSLSLSFPPGSYSLTHGKTVHPISIPIRARSDPRRNSRSHSRQSRQSKLAAAAISIGSAATRSAPFCPAPAASKRKGPSKRHIGWTEWFRLSAAAVAAAAAAPIAAWCTACAHSEQWLSRSLHSLRPLAPISSVDRRSTSRRRLRRR